MMHGLCESLHRRPERQGAGRGTGSRRCGHLVLCSRERSQDGRCAAVLGARQARRRRCAAGGCGWTTKGHPGAHAAV